MSTGKRTGAVVHFPADPGPYQGPLMDALRAAGVEAEYLPVPEHVPLPAPLRAVARIVALPFALVLARVRGARILHLHWVYPFTPGPSTPTFLRRAARGWFGVQLALARALGLRIVWTAHNVLPHHAVFDDDVAARRALVQAADGVIVHHASTAAELARRFGPPARVAVIAQGAPDVGPLPSRLTARRALGIPSDRVLVALFGRIAPYKGVPVLLRALARLEVADRASLVVLVAGELEGPGTPEGEAHGREIARLAAASGVDVRLALHHLSEGDLRTLLAGADLACLPFLRIDNSASVITALAAGLPVIVPAHPSLAELPDAAVIRYDPATFEVGCADALGRILAIGPGGRAAMSGAARRWAAGHGWAAAGRATAALYREILEGATP